MHDFHIRGRAALVIAIGILAAVVMTASADVPRIITYQGCLTDSLGHPVPDGNYNLIFALYADPSGGEPVWSNDVVKAGQPVEVTGGMFTYSLGAAAPLPPEIFNDPSLWLGITIAGEDASEMTPRVQLTSAPFAYRALFADNVPSGGGWVQGPGIIYPENPADMVGIGTLEPTFKLEVKSSATGDGLRVTSSDGDQLFRVRENSDGSCQAQVSDASGATTVYIRGGGNSTFNGGNVGLGNTAPSERLVVGEDMGAYSGEMVVIGNSASGSYSGVTTGEDTDNRGWIVWKNDNNQLVLGTKQDGVSYDNSVIVSGGNVGIGTVPSYPRLYVKDNGTPIHAENEGSTGGAAVSGKSNNPLGQGVKGFAVASNGKGVWGLAQGNTGYGVLAEASGTSGVALYAEATGALGVALYAEVSGEARTAISANADVNFGTGIEARGGISGKAAKFFGNVAIYSRADDGLVMELGEGLDYAEGFDLSDPTKAKPGTVVAIDPDNPGRLMISNTAYDTRVAGIVAGANGLGSGVRLGAGGFDRDIALAGRVYCNVETTEAAIEPGDLLTTSSRPGFAMKAVDYAKAQGAILGKAMQKMEKGQTGRILVLVTLQ